MLRLLAIVAVGLALPGVGWGQSADDRSRVYFAMDPNALVRGLEPSPAVVRGMVNAVVTAVTGKRTTAEAWRSLAGPKDVVGIKVAAGPGREGGTHEAVVIAVSEGLQSAGVSPSNILVWDRNEADLRRAGYSKNSPYYQLRWVDPTTGYDRDAMLTAPVLGRLIWGDSKFGEREGTRLVDRLSSGDQLSSTSYYARILSQEVTKVINLPSLCDSFMSGINGAIANMTLWNVDNWRRFTKEPNFGNPYLAEIYADPLVKDKVVLTMMDALTLQFAGGPFPNPNFVRPNFTIYASGDPVALDATALRLLEEYRLLNKLPTLKETAAHVESAAIMGLGRFYENEIDVIRAGVE